MRVKVYESWYKQSGVTPHFSTGKIDWKKYWQKINIDIINWEKICDRSATSNNANPVIR